MQHTFTIHRKSVRVSATHGGKQFRKATGLYIQDETLWDSGAKSLRAKCKDRRIQRDLMLINARLTEREIDVRTERDVLAAIEYAITGKEAPAPPSSCGVPTFWEYFEDWGNRPSSSQRQRALAVRVVARLMGRNENWDEIDSSYWFRLQRRLEDEGYSVNYRWNIGTRLKCAMHEGYKLKFHSNQDFREFKCRKESSDAIALSPREIEQLWDYVPKTPTYGKVRDLALIGFYTASRFSDFSRLSSDDIRGDRVEFVQKKTGDKVILPASPRLLLLLERNGGHAPLVCQVVFNRYIKEIARDAGIDGYETVRGRRIPRWECVQSHTFRRSAITALYLSGVPIKDCMYASGHKSISAFEGYLRIGKEQAVARLAGAELFK